MRTEPSSAGEANVVIESPLARPSTEWRLID